MASKNFSKALRGPLSRQLASPAVQRRTFVSAINAAARPAAVAATRAARPAQQQTRGVKTIDFAGSKEEVWGEFLGFN